MSDDNVPFVDAVEMVSMSEVPLADAFTLPPARRKPTITMTTTTRRAATTAAVTDRDDELPDDIGFLPDVAPMIVVPDVISPINIIDEGLVRHYNPRRGKICLIFWWLCRCSLHRFVRLHVTQVG